MSIILEAGLDDTGQIRKIADDNYRARSRPVDVGPFMVTAALFLAAALWVIPAIDNDRFAIDATRWAMAAAASGIVIAALVCGLYVLDRRNRTRHDEVMAHIDSLRTLACHNGSGIGQLALAQQRAARDRVVQEVLSAVERRAPEARKLSRSEYWEVYQDVMADLGDVSTEE